MFARINGEWSDSKNDYVWKKLSEAADYYGYCFEPHNSLNDVKATLFVYNKIINKAAKPDKNKLAELYKNARKARDNGKPDEALRIYTELAELDGNNWEPHFYKAILLGTHITLEEMSEIFRKMNQVNEKCIGLIHRNIKEKTKRDDAIKEIVLYVYMAGSQCLETLESIFGKNRDKEDDITYHSSINTITNMYYWLASTLQRYFNGEYISNSILLWSEGNKCRQKMIDKLSYNKRLVQEDIKGIKFYEGLILKYSDDIESDPDDDL